MRDRHGIHGWVASAHSTAHVPKRAVDVVLAYASFGICASCELGCQRRGEFQIVRGARVSTSCTPPRATSSDGDDEDDDDGGSGWQRTVSLPPLDTQLSV